MSPSILAASHASSHLLAALIPVLLIIAAFDAYCLADLVRAHSVRFLPKIVWGLIIVIVGSPISGVVYLFVGRGRDGQGAAR
jgi:hypothetical protein